MPDFSLFTGTTPLLETTELEHLLLYLRHVHQVDLTGYKHSILMRRTVVRMQQVRAERYQDYLNYLQQHPPEVVRLLEAIYINYTYFFRDRPIWDYLANQVIPQIIANKIPNQPIRVWSAGCASGEETYALAMLFIEALGIDQFQQQVQLYGTDVDADAILQSQRGCYLPHTIELIPPVLRSRYFECREDFYCWRQEFHHTIHFQVHNLLQDSVLPHIDLLVCRNLLMYFTAETQLQVLTNFYLSLQENGFLWLGHAEGLVTRLQRSLFKPLHLQGKVFTKVLNAHESSPLLSCLLPNLDCLNTMLFLS